MNGEFFVKNEVELLEIEVTAEDSTTLGGVIAHLPKGASVIAAGVEINTTFASGAVLSVGYTGAPAALVAATATTTKGLVLSTLNKRENIVVTFDKIAATGSAIVRVLYALPTKVPRSY